MKHSIMLAGASMVALLLGSTTVSAATVSLKVCNNASETSCWNADSQIADGVVVNWTNVETTTNSSGVSADTWATNHSFNLDSWSLSMDSDPLVANNFTITNSSGSTQTYSIGATIGVSPTIPFGAMRGSIGFSLTDNTDNNTDAKLETSGASIYQGMIDGNSARTLWDPSTSFTAPSGSFASSTSFGFPSRLIAPESVDTNIGILITFSLTDGDSVAFTSNFDVVPVPVPAAIWLFGSGLLGLLGVSRRKLR
jgi:hypothetical protein